MKLKNSQFKQKDGFEWMQAWHKRVFEHCQLDYTSMNLETNYGNTHVWCKNHGDQEKPALVFLPGFRTCGIFWELNNCLEPFYEDYRIYLVDVIGQAGLSALTSPKLKGDDFGHWLVEVLDGLGVDKAVFSGASYGGQLLVKLATVAPHRIEMGVGFNPVGVQFVNLGPRASWYNIMISLFPSRKNVALYLEKMVIDPSYKMKAGRRELLIEYQSYVVQEFKFGCDYPYKFSDAELKKYTAPAYYLLCKDDRLISQEKTAMRAKAVVPNFKKAIFFSKIGHGIEVAPEAFVEFKKLVEGHFN